MFIFYFDQYGFKGVYLMAANLYGRNDNFHPLNGHVIPALMQKFSNWTVGDDPVQCWGTGTPRREFLYVDDLADACLFAMENYSNAELLNVGSGQDVTIKELAETVAGVVGYSGDIVWDTTRPDGTPKRPLDYSKLLKKGWKPKYNLLDGLRETYKWYVENTLDQTK
jgi:GDP-L-fucose synthase